MASTWPIIPDYTTAAVQTASFTASDNIRYPVDTLTAPTTQLVVTPQTFGSGASFSTQPTITAGAVTAAGAITVGGTLYNSNVLATVGSPQVTVPTIAFTAAAGILTVAGAVISGGSGLVPGFSYPVNGGTGGRITVNTVDVNGGVLTYTLSAPGTAGYTTGNLTIGAAAVTPALLSFTVSGAGVLSVPAIASAGANIPAGETATIWPSPKTGQKMIIVDNNSQNWVNNNPVVNFGAFIYERVRFTNTPIFVQMSVPRAWEFIGGATGWQSID
jgi:hypothetical protein